MFYAPTKTKEVRQGHNSTVQKTSWSVHRTIETVWHTGVFNTHGQNGVLHFDHYADIAHHFNGVEKAQGFLLTILAVCMQGTTKKQICAVVCQDETLAGFLYIAIPEFFNIFQSVLIV